ncbi:MAG: hypothetical protein RR090_12765 [Niameybacter sp.]
MNKTFSLTNSIVLKKLKEVDNQSKYIEALILKDIISCYGGVEFEQRIDEVLDLLILQIDEIRKEVKTHKVTQS